MFRKAREYLRQRKRARSLEKVKKRFADVEPEFLEIYRRRKPYTMTHAERIYALFSAVRYVVREGVPGDFVECGVWRGGSAMVVALTLLSLGDRSRRIYLYDTFTGMSDPTPEDVSPEGQPAAVEFEQRRMAGQGWCDCDLATVRQNLLSTGYPADKIVFSAGKVEDTIPGTIPDRVALLRLDTDWYESTKHELVHLYPRLEAGGVMILDDYGYWKGARQATDEYIRDQRLSLFLNRIDGSARLCIKPRVT